MSDESPNKLEELEAQLASLEALRPAIGEAAYRSGRANLEAQIRQVQTGGGAYIEGGVSIQGGDFVNRDKIINISVQLLRSFRPDFTGDLQQATQSYLTFLYDQHCYLSLKGLGVSDRVPLRLPLLDLYIPLRVRLELPRGETWQEEVRLAGRRLSAEEMQQMRLSEPQPVLDVLKEHAGLVLLGDPGAGKSTFLKYLTLQMALGQGEELGLGGRLPVLVPLAAYANALEDADIRLDDFIADYFCHTCGDLPVGDMLRDALKAGRALVLLDGLDEVKVLSMRSTVVERAMAFYNFHRRAGNKFVLTSRIVGYREVRPSAQGLVEGTLVDLDDEEIAGFVERWTAALERQAQGPESAVARAEAEREQRELLFAIQNNPGVRQLAANPLLLTILAVMKRQGVTLPDRRVELYDQYVKTMLSVWNRARSLTGRAAGPELDVVQTVRILAPLALWMHQVNPGVGLVKREDLRRRLEDIYRERGEADPEAAARVFLADVHEHTGLLLERGPGEYGFIHLTFEEYLAGVAIALRGQGNAQALLEQILPAAGQPAWREALLLSINYVALIQQLDKVAEQVIELLVDKDQVILAGEAAADLRAGGLGQDTIQLVQGSLLKQMRGSESVPAVERARAGDTLARLGDPRPEVMAIAEMPFCFIPGGAFRMGDDRKNTLDLPAFWLAQYPVTQAQFEEFWTAGGYREKRYWPEAVEAGYWMEAGFKGSYDNEPRGRPVSFGGPFELPNHPVVGVSWYEAAAFCRWLDELAHTRGWLSEEWQVRLPVEAQWEKAARGGKEIPVRSRPVPLCGIPAEPPAVRMRPNPLPERAYPWGETFDPEYANTSEGKIGGTSVVGCFPGGAGPYGNLDLSGNVWDWCSGWSVEGKYRGLRGGSWFGDRSDARCAYRNGGGPGYWGNYIGFRCVLSR